MARVVARTRELYIPRKRLSRKAKQRRAAQKLQDGLDAASTHLVLSHGHCLDGVGSAIVLRRALGDGMGVVYIQPSAVGRTLHRLRDVPCNGRELIIADLSLQPKDYDSIVTSCATLQRAGWTIQWYDHHHKQWEGLDLGRLQKRLEVLEVNDDATESGATLVQQALAPKDAFAKKFAETVRDRDLWWNRTPDSETLEFALRWMGTDDFTDHFLKKTGRNKVVDDAIADAAHQQRRQNEEHQDELIGQTRYWTTKHGDRLAIVYGWMPKNVGLHALLQHQDVAVAININPGGRMSIRSRSEWTVCHKIAGRFDGGGHPNASGGLVGVDRWFTSRWYVLRRGRVPQVERLAQAAVEEMERFHDEELA